MADFNNAIMTTGGAALLAATTAGTSRLKFTKLVTGSGIYTEQEKTRGRLQARTSLKDQKQEIPFSSITMASETCVKLVALVSNAMLTVGYYVNEVGIYAVDELNEDAEPVLYSIAIANVADYLPPYNGLTPSTITQEYFATVDNALEVTIQTKAGAVALAEDLEALEERLNATINSSISTVIQGNISMFAQEYDSGAIYQIGDYCIRENQLYKRSVNINEAEEWNPEHWEQTTIAKEFQLLNNKVVETVDPMEATELGAAADAQLTGEAIRALNANLGGIMFGFTEDGQPGYVTTGEDGADAVIPFSMIVRIGVGYDSQPFTQNYKNLHMATGQADYYVYKHNGKNTWIPYKVGTIVTMDVFAGDVISFTVGNNGPARPYTAWIGQTDGVVLTK